MDTKVIFHIDEAQKWPLLLGNVTNLLLTFEDEVFNTEIKVLANSEAVKGYLEDTGGLSALMEALSKKGVQFLACHHAMQNMNITDEQIYSFVKIVPAGVRELVDRQIEGYAYIKP